VTAVGKTIWAIPEGYIPSQSTSGDLAFLSHETVCMLNAGAGDANVSIAIFFADREPVGPYWLTVPPRCTKHLRFNDLTDPAPVPRDTDYTSLLESDRPVVVQHTRLASRKSKLVLLTTIAFGQN